MVWGFAGEIIADGGDDDIVDNTERDYEESYDEKGTVESQKSSKEVACIYFKTLFWLHSEHIMLRARLVQLV